MHFKLNLLSLAKLFVLIFMLYTAWIRYAYGVHQFLLYAPPIALTGIVLLHMITHGNLNIKDCPSIIVAFFALAIYALISGSIVATYKSYCMSSIATFFAHSLICFAVYYISREEKSVDWILNILIICGTVCSAYVYLRGFSYATSGVNAITIGEDSNPNFLGFVMLTSIFALILDFDKFRKRMMLNTILLAAFSVVVIMTASRKCFLALIMMLVGWIFSFMKALAKEEAPSDKRFYNSVYQVLVLVGIVFSIVYFIRNFEGTGVYTKIMNSITKGDGVGSRTKLYKEAWILFKRNYPMGVGFDQFRFYSSEGLYSHSTYAEIASCLGVFGLVIFFSPVIWTYFRIIISFLRHSDYVISMIFIMFTVELILALGQIIIYEFYQMLVMTLIFYLWQQRKNQNSIDLAGEIYEKCD